MTAEYIPIMFGIYIYILFDVIIILSIRLLSISQQHDGLLLLQTEYALVDIC